MDDDFLPELGLMAFTARIKRLSDNLQYDGKAYYKALGLEIEINWHLIFLVLEKEGELSVTEISQRLGFSHPAIIKIIKKMKERGFIESKSHGTDGRVQLLSLTPKAVKLLPAYHEQWNRIQKVINRFVSPILMDELLKTEKDLTEKKFIDRLLENHYGES